MARGASAIRTAQLVLVIASSSCAGMEAGSSNGTCQTRWQAPISCAAIPNALFCEDWSSGYIQPWRWTHEISATGGGNSEFQMYTQHPRNSFVLDSSLHIMPSFTYHQFGDLRGDLDLHAMGCTSDWNHGCRNLGSLHADSGNPGGKLWASQVTDLQSMPALRDAIAEEGLPQCDEKNGICNHMIPVGGLRGKPIMSAKLLSRASFKYGRFEFLATLPRGDYLWPALWLLPTGAGPWPTGGEIDVMESMGNAPGGAFALDYSSTSAALHFGRSSSWYDLAYTPTFEQLLGVEFGTLAGRRDLQAGPHTFGLYWASDNIYMYVDDDSRRVLDMDRVFRLKGRSMLDSPPTSSGPIPAAERLAIAALMVEKGYAVGWRNFSLACNRDPKDLWPAGGSPNAPFDRPFHMIMNLAVGGDFFKGNLNPHSREAAMYDVPIERAGQVAPMYWYSRMRTWWSSWARPDAAPLPSAFADSPITPSAYLETENTWRLYANGGQDAGRASVHKADTHTAVTPPPDSDIDSRVALKVHRVVVYPVEGSEGPLHI